MRNLRVSRKAVSVPGGTRSTWVGSGVGVVVVNGAMLVEVANKVGVGVKNSAVAVDGKVGLNTGVSIEVTEGVKVGS
jgi:hypothetical protein